MCNNFNNMYYKNTFQARINVENFHRRHDHKINNTFSQNVVNIKNYTILFLKTSSIHGLNHFVAVGRHLCERLLWVTMVILSVVGTIHVSEMTWARYQSSPTVISMERDMLSWNTTFPGVTICLDNKIDLNKLDDYLRSSQEPDKEKLREFITALANATYENFSSVPKYDGIAPEDYLSTLINLASPFKAFLTVGVGTELQTVPTITEMGLCHAVNSKVAVYNSPEYRKANRWDIIESKNATLSVHPLDGEILAQALNISDSYRAYIHGPLEVPDISSKNHRAPQLHYMKIYVTATSVYISPEAASLSICQRRCRFQEENNLKHNSIYTYTMCRMECRIKLCLKYCNCIPHFYRRSGGEKICDVSGLQCLHNYTDILMNLRYKGENKVNCDCFPICEDVNYVTQSFELQAWVLGTNFQWGIVTYPRMRYRRDVIFGFTDVLVAVGGMAGLFLGCSVLSFMEIIYFLTLRLVCTRRMEKK